MHKIREAKRRHHRAAQRFVSLFSAFFGHSLFSPRTTFWGKSNSFVMECRRKAKCLSKYVSSEFLRDCFSGRIFSPHCKHKPLSPHTKEFNNAVFFLQGRRWTTNQILVLRVTSKSQRAFFSFVSEPKVFVFAFRLKCAMCMFLCHVPPG